MLSGKLHGKKGDVAAQANKPSPGFLDTLQDGIDHLMSCDSRAKSYLLCICRGLVSVDAKGTDVY